MDKKKVILDPSGRQIDEIFCTEDLDRLNDIADVVWGRNEPMPKAELESARGDVFAVIAGNWRHGSPREMPKLRAILEVGGSLPRPKALDYAYCFSHGIRVLSCSPAFGPPVAEMALTMALASARKIIEGHNGFLTGEETYLHEGNVGTFSLSGQTVGFIGFGGLARALKPLLAPFDCAIRVYDPWLPDSYLRNQGVQPCGLDELLASSRVIFVLAIPLPSNKGLLDRARLEHIQPGSVLVLISRAHLVDFDALTELVSAGRFRAAIDVFPTEPVPMDHPIRKAPGTILSGHRAANVPQALHAIGKMVVDDLEALIAGLPPTGMLVAQPEIVQRFS